MTHPVNIGRDAKSCVSTAGFASEFSYNYRFFAAHPSKPTASRFMLTY
jgi:hypothetical protein